MKTLTCLLALIGLSMATFAADEIVYFKSPEAPRRTIRLPDAALTQLFATTPTAAKVLDFLHAHSPAECQKTQPWKRLGDAPDGRIYECSDPQPPGIHTFTVPSESVRARRAFEILAPNNA